jgi:hypothetical protein
MVRHHKKVWTQQRWASKRRMDMYLSGLHIQTHNMQTHHAVTFSKELRRKIVSQDVVALSIPPTTLDDVECPKCKLTENIVKDGKRYNKKGLIQKYLCRVVTIDL